MNVGDKIAVTIQGSEIAQAEVKEVGEGTATLIVPATRVVMAVRTELAPEVTPTADGSGTETIIDEVVRTDATDITPVPQANASGEDVPPTNSAPSDDASKVITSSSVPSPDAAAEASKFEALDPKVQAQIMAIVAEHNQAQAKVEPNTGDAPMPPDDAKPN